MSTSTFRLPTHVSPVRYDIQLNAEVGREDFSGHETIALFIHQEKDIIILHSRDLIISDVNLDTDGQSLPAEVVIDPNDEKIVLQFAQALPRGEALLSLAFRGKINQHLKGLYLAQNLPEQMLCTQCEATDARAIFPCFDEPTFKAQFAVEVTTPDAVVLSNGPLLSITDSQTSKTWKFAPTRPMSSYLFALVIGDLAGTEEIIVNGVPLRIWAMRGKEQFGTFALEFTTRLLPWYENYFGVPYHYDKFDQVAVPGFAAGAMENSGLVIFRQEFLIMEPESSSWKQKRSISLIIAHEFAHMWFGNLVTMQWWDDLWLNEAFAQWMCFRVNSELSPEYRCWDYFQTGQDIALVDDALETTHPIYCPVETPAQAEELFDAITYLKGCSVLRMLENFLGEENFREGLRTYMKEFSESNACGADLWRHLQAASRQPVTHMMESWILQGGYPCVTATLQTISGEQQLQLGQKRFFKNPQAPRDNQQLWQIPLVVRYADDAGTHEVRHLLTEATGMMTLPTQGEMQWCYLNADQIGFYRQSLDRGLFNQLLPHLRQLTASEQMGFLGDQWALTQRGDQSIIQFLEVLTALSSQSDDYNLLSQILVHLHTLEQMVEDLRNIPLLEQFRRRVRSLFHERLKALGFEPGPGEPMEVLQQRISVIDAMASLAHDPETIAQACVMAEREAIDPHHVDPNLAATILAINAQFGDEALFNRYVQIYSERKASGASPQTVTRYLYSFPHFRTPDLVNQTLGLFDEGITPQEALLPILYQMLYERHSQTAAWQFIKDHWLTVKETALGASELIKSAGYLPHSMRNDFVDFCEANVRGVADMSYAQALETMDFLAGFQARSRDELIIWLNRDVAL